MLNLLLNLNLSSFSSLFELFCAFNFGYATIKPIRDAIHKNTREELKKRFRADKELSFLVGIAQDLDNGKKITFSEMSGEKLQTAPLVIKVLNTIRENHFDITGDENERKMFTLYFFEKTESLFLYYGVMAMLFLFIGGIANDYYTALNTLPYSLNDKVKIDSINILYNSIYFWYNCVFYFSLFTLLYSLVVFFISKNKGIKMSITILVFIVGLLLSIAISFITPKYYNISQSTSTLSALVVLIIPYILFFIVPIIIDNYTIKEIIKSIDKKRQVVLEIISAISNESVSAESVKDFKDILEPTLNPKSVK